MEREKEHTVTEALLRYTVRQIFSDGNFTVRGFVERNYSKVLHVQEFYEINIVLRGSAVHSVGERTLRVGKGDVFIIPPELPHSYDGGEGFDVCHVLLSPQYLEKYAASLAPLQAFPMLFRIDPLIRAKTSAKLYFRLTSEELARISGRLEALTERSRGERYADALICEGEALALIAELCDAYERRVGARSTGEDEDAAFLASIAYLYAHYNERLTVDALAKIARMSRNAYIARFKRIMGVPPARLLRLHRVERIKQMLTDTSLTVSEIAHASGCTDASHMIRLFSAETGTTPAAYRRAATGKRI